MSIFFSEIYPNSGHNNGITNMEIVIRSTAGWIETERHYVF